MIIGCGRRIEKKIIAPNGKHDYQAPVTLDLNPDHRPILFITWNSCPSFKDNIFGEIHAYEVLEHTGAQGITVSSSNNSASYGEF